MNHIERVQRHLVQAQAVLLLPTTEAKAEAFLFIALAMLELAKSDPEEKVLACVVRKCERVRQEGS